MENRAHPVKVALCGKLAKRHTYMKGGDGDGMWGRVFIYLVLFGLICKSLVFCITA